MPDEVTALLNAILDEDPKLPEGARWTALLAAAARRHQVLLETGLAQGELEDALHVDAAPPVIARSAEPARPLAAASATPAATRARYRHGQVEVVLAINPEGGGFALLRGAPAARVEGLRDAVSLESERWCRVPDDWSAGFPPELRLVLPDGEIKVVARTS